MINKILNVCIDYISNNDLLLKFNYIRDHDWYILYFLNMNKRNTYKHKWIVQQYNNSIVINVNNNRYDISAKDLDDVLNRSIDVQTNFINTLLK